MVIFIFITHYVWPNMLGIFAWVHCPLVVIKACLNGKSVQQQTQSETFYLAVYRDNNDFLNQGS